MDVMQPYELHVVKEAIAYTDRNSWEQTRLRMYGLASMFSKKELSLQDIMKFPWEEDDGTKEMSNADRDRLKARAEAMARNMK